MFKIEVVIIEPMSRIGFLDLRLPAPLSSLRPIWHTSLVHTGLSWFHPAQTRQLQWQSLSLLACLCQLLSALKLSQTSLIALALRCHGTALWIPACTALLQPIALIAYWRFESHPPAVPETFGMVCAPYYLDLGGLLLHFDGCRSWTRAWSQPSEFVVVCMIIIWWH